MRVKLYGPPGTGKTRQLLRVVEKALQSGIPPERIAYITFTVRGRREALNRANETLGLNAEQLEYFRTLHSIAYRQLGATRESLITRVDQLQGFAELMGLDFPTKFKTTVDDEVPYNYDDTIEGGQMLSFDHYTRQMLMTPRVAWKSWPGAQDMDVALAERFSRSYEMWKLQQGLMDFTDLLEFPLEPLDVDVVIVDEAQDLSPLQWRLLERIASKATRIYVAGDDDQAIYQWAGASPESFIAFPVDDERVLKQSYRVPQAVQRVAERVINPIRTRKSKLWHARDEAGAVKYHGDISGVMEVLRDETETLVLFRTHSVGTEIEYDLRNNGVPYAYADESLPNAFNWVSSIYAWERLRKQDRVVLTAHILELIRAMSIPRAERKLLVQRVVAYEEAHAWTREDAADIGLNLDLSWNMVFEKIPRYDLEYIRAIIRHRGSRSLISQPRVRISTIHAAKGAQADHVVLYTHMTGKVREAMEDNPDPERRVFYVGVTRARQKLSVIGLENPLF